MTVLAIPHPHYGLSLNGAKSRYSLSYLYAVCSHAGCTVTERRLTPAQVRDGLLVPEIVVAQPDPISVCSWPPVTPISVRPIRSPARDLAGRHKPQPEVEYQANSPSRNSSIGGHENSPPYSGKNPVRERANRRAREWGPIAVD